MEDNMFEQIINLSKISLEITLLQHEVIKDLVGKLRKYEDVTEYEKFLDMMNGTDGNKEEDKEEDKKEDKKGGDK